MIGERERARKKKTREGRLVLRCEGGSGVEERRRSEGAIKRAWGGKKDRVGGGGGEKM